MPAGLVESRSKLLYADRQQKESGMSKVRKVLPFKQKERIPESPQLLPLSPNEGAGTPGGQQYNESMQRLEDVIKAYKAVPKTKEVR
jgi:hypothetical protein